MAADLFETYVVTLGVTMVSIALLIRADVGELMKLMSLPLIVGGVCIITSVIGTYMVRLGSSGSIMGALYKGFGTSALLSVPAIYLVTKMTLGDLNTPIGAPGFLDQRWVAISPMRRPPRRRSPGWRLPAWTCSGA